MARWTFEAAPKRVMERTQKPMIIGRNSLSRSGKNSFPLRTQIALALLRNHDEAAAQKQKAAFEKTARSYPYPVEIAGERELIALAEEKAAG